MKVSTEIASAARIIGEEKAVEYIAKAGFDAWDFSMFEMCRYDYEKQQLILPNEHPLANNDYLKFARKLRNIGLDNGIVCNQSHAPYPSKGDVRSYLKRAIECTAEAGGKICIIHPSNDNTLEQNAELYLELLPFAKDTGVKIATENMWNWDFQKEHASPAACSSHQSFKALLDLVNDDYLVGCVDIGHAEMKGLETSAYEMIKYLGNKVQALHIHDNDKVNDFHMLPYEGQIDFSQMIKALKEIDYKGYFTLEADTYFERNGYTKENIFNGIKNMAKVAKELSNQFEGE
ncbi:MAG: sugar phosphate isomerase/epimerase family protein [Clostridia bacterium]|nr:sugar phosphate isomerase/epimerase family protein [Clostridia bacterium]